MTFEPSDPTELSDPLGTLCVPNFDAEAEACPACFQQIDSWSLESAHLQSGLCACPGCGVVTAA